MFIVFFTGRQVPITARIVQHWTHRPIQFCPSSPSIVLVNMKIECRPFHFFQVRRNSSTRKDWVPVLPWTPRNSKPPRNSSIDGLVKSRHPVGERGPGFLQLPGNTGWRFIPIESGPQFIPVLSGLTRTCPDVSRGIGQKDHFRMETR